MLLLKWQEGRRPRRLLCFSAAFFIASLIVSLLFVREETLFSTVLLSGAAVMALIAVVIFFLREDVVLFWSLLAGFLVGWLWCCGFLLLAWQPTQAYGNQKGMVRLEMDEYPEAKGEYGIVFGTVTELDGAPCRLRVKAYLADGSPEFAPGDVLCFQGKFRAAERSWRQNLLQEGYFLTLSQEGDATVLSGQAPTLMRKLRIISHQITLRIQSFLPGDEGALLSALLSGNRSGFSNDFDRALTRSGLRHMTAVSGLHVSILAGFLIWLLGKRLGLLASVPFTVLYAAVTGFSPSVIRAAVLLLFWSASFWLKEEKDSLTALAAALLLLIARNPFSVMSVGLLLSFAATLGLILLSASLQEILVQPLYKIKNRRLQNILKYIVGTVCATLAATLFTMPLNILFFEAVPLLSILSNVLVLWAVTLTMVLGILILLISLLLPVAAAKLAAGLLYWPLHWMVWVIRKIGELPFASTDSANLILSAACLVLLIVVLFWRGKLISSGRLLVWVMVVLCFTVTATAAERTFCGVVEVYNRGGQPMILLRGDGIALLNCGSDITAATDVAESALSRWNMSELDAVICSSESYKTQGGLFDLLQNITVEKILLPSADGVVASRYKGYSILSYSDGGSIEAAGVEIQLLKVGDNYALRLWTSGFSLLDVSGLKPQQAISLTEEHICAADILVASPSLLDTWTIFEQVRNAVLPQEILLLTNDYSEEGNFYPAFVTKLGWESVQYRFLR